MEHFEPNCVPEPLHRAPFDTGDARTKPALAQGRGPVSMPILPLVRQSIVSPSSVGRQDRAEMPVRPRIPQEYGDEGALGTLWSGQAAVAWLSCRVVELVGASLFQPYASHANQTCRMIRYRR